MSKPPILAGLETHHRSPPVCFLGTVSSFIPISGTVARKKDEQSAQHCAELNINVRNRGQGPWEAHLLTLTLNPAHRMAVPLRLMISTIGWPEGMTLLRRCASHRAIQGKRPCRYPIFPNYPTGEPE